MRARARARKALNCGCSIRLRPADVEQRVLREGGTLSRRRPSSRFDPRGGEEVAIARRSPRLACPSRTRATVFVAETGARSSRSPNRASLLQALVRAGFARSLMMSRGEVEGAHRDRYALRSSPQKHAKASRSTPSCAGAARGFPPVPSQPSQGTHFFFRLAKRLQLVAEFVSRITSIPVLQWVSACKCSEVPGSR